MASIVCIGRVSDAHPGTPLWTPAARAELARETLPYTSRLTDAEWARIAPLLPVPVVRGTRASLQRVHGWGYRPHVGMMRRFELTDAQWEQIAPLLPPQKPRTGRPAEDHRQVLNGMLWILRTGAPWEDLPARYGAVGTVSSRFYRWRKAGVFDRVLQRLQAQADARGDLDWDLHFVDATVVRAHQHAAGARRSGAIGG